MMGGVDLSMSFWYPVIIKPLPVLGLNMAVCNREKLCRGVELFVSLKVCFPCMIRRRAQKNLS